MTARDGPFVDPGGVPVPPAAAASRPVRPGVSRRPGRPVASRGCSGRALAPRAEPVVWSSQPAGNNPPAPAPPAAARPACRGTGSRRRELCDAHDNADPRCVRPRRLQSPCVVGLPFESADRAVSSNFPDLDRARPGCLRCRRHPTLRADHTSARTPPADPQSRSLFIPAPVRPRANIDEAGVSEPDTPANVDENAYFTVPFGRQNNTCSSPESSSASTKSTSC